MITDWKTLDLQSMDLVLCAGNGKLSRKIQWFQRLVGADDEAANISHIAGVVRDGGRIEVQESTTMNKWAGKRGVQSNPFDEWLEHYNGDVYIRRLTFKRTLTFRNDDLGFWTEHQNDDYENGIPGYMELFLCGLRLHRFVRRLFPKYVPKFTDEPHCSELQAKRMEVHNLWDMPVVVNRMPPHLWWNTIDRWLKVPIDLPIQIK